MVMQYLAQIWWLSKMQYLTHAVMMTQNDAILDPVMMTQSEINSDESSAETVPPEILTRRTRSTRTPNVYKFKKAPSPGGA